VLNVRTWPEADRQLVSHASAKADTHTIPLEMAVPSVQHQHRYRCFGTPLDRHYAAGRGSISKRGFVSWRRIVRNCLKQRRHADVDKGLSAALGEGVMSCLQKRIAPYERMIAHQGPARTVPG
jgi:hypothetical protein